jgi:hypothetical protein
MSAMPAAPEELESQMADRGKQGRATSPLAGRFQEELGVVPSATARATAARIFAARIRVSPREEFGWELLPKV